MPVFDVHIGLLSVWLSPRARRGSALERRHPLVANENDGGSEKFVEGQNYNYTKFREY